ncbi:non-ribosomal peptide synthetase [Saccharopolyspora pogona]|uniref:non-ribosomal peptide synthetase n=1 Tax=Saccharopolyspora pogona TaxID=333966 RepID=UPI00295B4F37|nr:amino acid adenylation domain-containing protein [Saccharopolyspora pogona]
MSTGIEGRIQDAMSDRDFWRAILTAGGGTAVPRWTTAHAEDEAVVELAVPDELRAAVEGLAERLLAPASAVFLTAHATVLSALSGDQAVVTGYATGTWDPLPCRLHVRDTSWAELLDDVRATEQDLAAHQDFPVDELWHELGRTDALFETVLRIADASDDRLRARHGDAALEFAFVREDEDSWRIRLHCPKTIGDTAYAERLVGYHLTALRNLVADPEARHLSCGLLSGEEFEQAVEGMAGPRRERPDKRFHELFEQRVAQHPDRIAAVLGDVRWTYAQLNERANQLARALLARGLQTEDVVGVVTERDLDWMASVIAIFKAGGAYLPIEPVFPADRITTMLERSECRLVLAQRGTEAKVRSLDAEFRTVLIGDAYREGHDGGDLGIAVGPDQLAYLYFTSGSTGRPKGVMCEQAGMLNHLFAKIEDLGVREDRAVAQIAPQCFDISLWQLVSALLVGGRTLLVPQEVILDVERFVDTVVEGRVEVLQVVPSYLEVVLTHLEERPRELPDLRCVSATGEALKMELVERWFATYPGIALANAYGLTETSDDTNHEVMTEVPDGDRVPLGRSVANVHVYVVDEFLSPVPLGAPGEIVFSGVCVGRGYINDEERTRAAFVPDPHRPGQRMYRSGDFGRWRPDGKLEFLGRRDAQVKIRGFRIEIGEIENRLLRVPGVRDGAVVVVDKDDRPHALAAFYSAQSELDPAGMRAFLAEALPEYMVPAYFHHRESLPLNGNGKIDKKTLAEFARSWASAESAHEAPGTPTELEVAEKWAAVLRVPVDQVGRNAHFFDAGGTSLSAIRLVVQLDRRVSLEDVARNPVLADLAAVLEAGGTPAQ